MKFLHIDDNERDQELCRALIKRTKNWNYSHADSVAEGLLLFETHGPQVVLIDIGFLGRPDQEAFDAITFMCKQATVIALSGRSDQEIVDLAHHAGAATFINKKHLGSPTIFHDAILAGLKRGLTGAILEDHRWQIVEQLAEHVVWGNGKPGLIARVEGIDEKLTAGDRRFSTIESKLDRGRLEQAAFFVIISAWLIFSFIQNETAILHGMKTEPLKSPVSLEK